MKRNAYRAQSLVLVVFLGLFFVLNLVLPDRSFSEQENRYLQTAPRFRLSELFSGRFTESFENYVTDQFALRDGWTTLKARAELLRGKRENNGICYCEDETLIEPFSAPAPEEFRLRLDAVNALQEQLQIPVCFALIPSAAEIRSDLLPSGIPNDSQQAMIAEATQYLNVTSADVYGALTAHADEQIFYRTDHHWTSLGAYYGYTAIAEAMGLTPVPLDSYTKREVTDAFYGTSCASSGFSWVRPDSIWTYVDAGDAVVTNYPAGQPVSGTVYDESALASRDKYRYFFGGNTPLLSVETGLTDAPSLLILRDSYMDSMSPFLFAHFSEIHILDLRYYRAGLDAYLSEHAVDSILICYSLPNFCEDANILLAAPNGS